MKVIEAKAIAKQWVEQRAKELPNFVCAFFVGSVACMHDDEDFPATSDIDLRIVVDQDVPDLLSNPSGEFAQTKLLVQGVILEPQYWSKDYFMKFASEILGNPLGAVSFFRPNAILDPNGDLVRAHRKVHASYQDAFWVRKRCANAQEHAITRLEQAASGQLSFPGATSKYIVSISMLYVAAIPNVVQIPCVANLKGITLRKCLVASRETLIGAGKGDLYKAILKIVGAYNITNVEASAHLAELESAFDYALRVIHTQFFGAFDIDPLSRPITINGSRDLIEAGSHREAMFWVICMRNWVQNAIENDGTEPEKTHFRSAYDHLLSAIGIANLQDIVEKADAFKQLLPEIMSAAHDIIDNHPNIYRQR